MVRPPSRRRFLATLAIPLASTPASGRRRRTGGSGTVAAQADSFDPTVHGFGFRNWSTRVPTFPEHDHEAVEEDRVRSAIEERWRGSADRTRVLDVAGLPGPFLDLVARQVYVSVNQRSATNGHCYGMVYGAQRYFERPTAIPLDRETASEVGHPADPLDAAEEPVGAEIDHFQNQQFFDLHAWLGRRMLLRPAWIDYRAQLSRLAAAVDEYGTTGITLMNTETRVLHEVLVYDYRRTSSGATLALYDPNWSAADYRARPRAEWPALRVDLGGERAVVGPYSRHGYDAFVFNALERTPAEWATLGSGGAGDRGGADPAWNPPAGALRPVVLFLVDAADVLVSVVGPDGRPVGRDRSAAMDREHTEYHAMRYRYGAAPGRYRVALTAADDAEYTLQARAAGADGDRLAATAAGSIRAGETHRYVATVPETAAGDGSLARVDGRNRLLGLAGAGVGVAGLAAGGYALVRERRRRDSVEGAGGPEGAE